MHAQQLATVPEAHLRAAEEICAHLVACRGGGAFLSSADAALLVGWLDEGRPVTGILMAIEHAAEARRKRRSRAPLTLRKVTRHLDRLVAARDTAVADRTSGPLREAVRWAREQGETALANALDAIPVRETETLVRTAAELVRTHIQSLWDRLSDPDRNAKVLEARNELEVLDLGYDDADLDTAAQELAYDAFRERWQALDTRALWEMARGGDR